MAYTTKNSTGYGTLTYTGSSYGFVHDTGLWEDLRFPAQGINPPGPDNAPARNATDGLLEFSASANNIISIVAQMPHGWKSGTNIHPHLHILTSSDPGANLKTRWRLGYKIMDVNDPEPSFTYANTDANVSAYSGGAAVHQLIELTELDMTGKQDSCCLHLLIQRSAGDSTNDTYAGVVRLLEFDIHYLVGTMGSIAEYGDNF